MTLTMYSERGVLIHSDPGYSTSPIGKLESHVLDHIESIKILKDQIRNGTEEESRLLNVFMFYALAAPSMEGKTQSAFAFKTILPLYFLLINMYLSAASVSMQEIYRNFAKLSDKFRKIAISDLKLFQSKISLNVNDFISPQELVKNHGDFKFLILGFLIALIEHANENFGSSGKCWMEFFTTSPRNFTISPMSINEVRRLDLGNYVLFFDEFEAADWSVFVRNLARAALIPVFVSNTNTKAIKPVERDQRSESDFMWALVCTHLNAMNMRIYSGMNSQNLSKMDLIALAAGNEQELG